MVDLKQALISPASVFTHPSEVVNHQEIEHQHKIKILEQWENDTKELLTATEENMDNEYEGESASDLLALIHQSLTDLREHH